MTDGERETFPDILESLEQLDEYRSVTDRYFTRRYCLKVDDIENNDYLILFHSNRICLLTLAPSHFFFKKNEEFKVNFSSGKVDRLKNAVRGKGKKGGQVLGPGSVVCTVEYGDGSSFDVPSCLKGTLMEVNAELVRSPELLRRRADAEGYIAAILSSIEVSRARKEELLPHEDYLKLLDDVMKIQMPIEVVCAIRLLQIQWMQYMQVNERISKMQQDFDAMVSEVNNVT